MKKSPIKLPESYKHLTVAQLRQIAAKLCEQAHFFACAAEAMEKAGKLTPAEKRYCKLEGIKQKDFLARKRAM